MKFSGHETFHIREGWLTKGMRLLQENPELFNSKNKFMHDELGVGSNMGKSIKHWLYVTGLSESSPNKRGEFQLSELGRVVLKNDPYLLDTFTWWVFHINLLHGKDASTSWYWFFNNFYQARFDRKACVESLRRYLQFNKTKQPSYQTLDRDLGCLLSSYARIIPEDVSDPEESYDSPFKELRLLLHFKESGSYQLNFDKKDISAEALGYSLAKAFEVDDNLKTNEVSVHDAALKEKGPGKCFLLATGDLFDLVEGMANDRKSNISISGLAGNRMISYRIMDELEWVRRHYKDKKQGATKG